MISLEQLKEEELKLSHKLAVTRMQIKEVFEDRLNTIALTYLCKVRKDYSYGYIVEYESSDLNLSEVESCVEDLLFEFDEFGYWVKFKDIRDSL